MSDPPTPDFWGANDHRPPPQAWRYPAMPATGTAAICERLEAVHQVARELLAEMRAARASLDAIERRGGDGG